MQRLKERLQKFYTARKKSCGAILLGFLLAMSSINFIAPPQPAHAIFGASWVLVIKEYALDAAANIIAKRMLRIITADTVNWINSGFQGNPGFVTNPGRLMNDAANSAFNYFLDGATSCFTDQNGQRVCQRLTDVLCSPFRLNIHLALRSNYNQGVLPYRCTIEQVVGNLDAFYNDFSRGGWQGWFTMTQNPGNMPFGAYLAAQDEMNLRVQSSVGIWQMQANWGRGLLSQQECTAIKTRSGEIKNDGSFAITDEYYGVHECPPGALEINTPGSVIEGQLIKTFGTGISGLELADEINEVIGALIDQFTLKLFTSARGLFGLKGQMNTSTPGIIGGVSLGDIIDARDPEVGDYCGSSRVGMFPTASLAISGNATFTGNRRDVTVQPGDTVTYSWCGANANQYASVYTVRNDLSGPSCAESGSNIPWIAQSAYGAQSATVSEAQRGCVYEITYSARNTAFEDVLSGNLTDEIDTSKLIVRVGDTPAPTVPGQCTISEVTPENLSAAANEINSEIAGTVTLVGDRLVITSSNGTALLTPVTPSGVAQSIQTQVAQQIGCTATSGLVFVVFQVDNPNALPPEMLAQLGTERPNQILVVIDNSGI